jgi:hypothetical protein
MHIKEHANDPTKMMKNPQKTKGLALFLQADTVFNTKICTLQEENFRQADSPVQLDPLL